MWQKDETEILHRKKTKPPRCGGFYVILTKDSNKREITRQRKRASVLFRGGKLWEGKLLGDTNGR